MSREEKKLQAAMKAGIKAGQRAYDEMMAPIDDAFYTAMKPLADACKNFDAKAMQRFREAEAAAKETFREAVSAAKADLHAARQESLRLYTEAAAPFIAEHDAAKASAEQLRRKVEVDTTQGWLIGYEDGQTGSHEGEMRAQLAIVAEKLTRDYGSSL